jgi:hypothetical protein
MLKIIFNLFLLFYCIGSQTLYYTESELPESIILDVKLLSNVDYNIHVNEYRLVISKYNGVVVLNFSMPQYVMHEKIKIIQSPRKVLIVLPKRLYDGEIVLYPKTEPIIKYKHIDIHEQVRLFGMV